MRDKTANETSGLLGITTHRTPGRRRGTRHAQNTQALRRSLRRGDPVLAENEELRQLKIRKETALVEKYERENKVSKGGLIDAAEDERRSVKAITIFRHKLEGAGAAMAARLAGMEAAEIQTTMDGYYGRILDEFEADYHRPAPAAIARGNE